MTKLYSAEVENIADLTHKPTEHLYIKKYIDELENTSSLFKVTLNYTPKRSLTFKNDSGVNIVSYQPEKESKNGLDFRLFMDKIPDIDICLYGKEIKVESKFFKVKHMDLELAETLENYIQQKDFLFKSNTFKQHLEGLTHFVFTNNVLNKKNFLEFDFSDVKTAYELIALQHDMFNESYMAKAKLKI